VRNHEVCMGVPKIEFTTCFVSRYLPCRSQSKGSEHFTSYETGVIPTVVEQKHVMRVVSGSRIRYGTFAFDKQI
jgi:hypothetical protein